MNGAASEAAPPTVADIGYDDLWIGVIVDRQGDHRPGSLKPLIWRIAAAFEEARQAIELCGTLEVEATEGRISFITSTIPDTELAHALMTDAIGDVDASVEIR